MAADYLELTDKRKVRIEIDWNALVNWSEITGADFQQFINLKTNIGQLRALAYCGAVEGEGIDGREIGLTIEDFGKVCNLGTIADFVLILNKQNRVAENAEKKKK